jgi:choline dehydrogenase-like flavoprotein
MARLSTEILVIGSGAGGAVSAVRLAEGGREVTVVEEGPWVDADAHEPFSLQEMVAKYRGRGPQGALGNPAIAYVEGRCVGGSTEINSGLFHRLPDHLAEEWRRAYGIDDFDPATLAGYAARVEAELGVSKLPSAPPPSSAALERGATKLGWRNVEFARVFRYDQSGRGTKQTMSRTLLPGARAAGARIIPDCRVIRLDLAADGRATGARCERTHPDGGREILHIDADRVVVAAGAVHTPALLQRSGIRGGIGRGLKVHPMIKIAARFPHPVDHGDVPMHRVTEFAPDLEIGGSASRRGYVALALADAGHDISGPMQDWENFSIYYASTKTEGSGRVRALPRFRAPLVTYKLTESDLSHLARGLVHLGEVLLAAGATELYPSLLGGPVARNLDEVGTWWDRLTRANTSLMTVHMTSTVRMGNDRARTGTDSYGGVWDHPNLFVNDGSLLPDAPGVNPQAAIMTIATRNAEHLLSIM